MSNFSPGAANPLYTTVLYDGNSRGLVAVCEILWIMLQDCVLHALDYVTV